MQIKSIVRYYLTSVRTIIIKMKKQIGMSLQKFEMLFQLVEMYNDAPFSILFILFLKLLLLDFLNY